ncbi:universal stress protein [Microbacterium terregens]
MKSASSGREAAVERMTVGFDGTEASFVALDWAAQRASGRPIQVEIATVDVADLFAEDVVDDALEDAVRRFRNIAPDAEVSATDFAGRMPGALLHAARLSDLLVIGAHHRRPVRSALTGWRPLRIVSHSEVPIVVVPDDWTDTSGPILVGIDDDDSSSGAVEFASAEAAASGVALTLLHAWRMPGPTMDGSVALLPSPIEEKAAQRRVLDRVCAQVVETHPEVKVDCILARDSPSPALLTESRRSSLLVIGTHRRGLLAGSFLGSVGQDVLVEARVPICVVPATASTP